MTSKLTAAKKAKSCLFRVNLLLGFKSLLLMKRILLFTRKILLADYHFSLLLIGSRSLRLPLVGVMAC